MSIYDNLSDANGNDIIEELNSLRKLIVLSSKLANAEQLLNDFETLTVELTLREAE